jgi:hypothetical protein
LDSTLPPNFSERAAPRATPAVSGPARKHGLTSQAENGDFLVDSILQSFVELACVIAFRNPRAIFDDLPAPPHWAWVRFH